ncbi:hypothetical protein DY000_02027588 [Brassica cretica]|uniref:Uncharacterized protein n=1 Tax=Brassica cretica TaxID=69181 RepID=A0ABQ7E3K0_BRACR|nr:hypothetical protein DY000_02027588 [Brassica cretica]
MIKIKKPRIQEEEDKNNVSSNISNIKKEFSRQLSAIDLNLRVDAEEEEAAKPESQTSRRYQGVLREDPRGGLRVERFELTVEPELIEKLYRRCGYFANSVLEEWVKEVLTAPPPLEII